MNDHCDVLLELALVSFPVAQQLVQGGNYNPLQLQLIDGPRMAFMPGRLQPADAPPDNGFAAAIVPMDSPELFTALAADNHLGKAMVAAICVLLPVRAGLYRASPNQFFLHPHENVSRNDGLMVVLHIILRDNAVVFHPGLVQEIGGIGFLQECVANVFLIAEDFIDGAGVPLKNRTV